MKKKVVFVLIGAAILLGVFGVIYLSGAQNRAEDEVREENPKFHTVPEGGVCRDGEGDCESGLTCVEGICETY